MYKILFIIDLFIVNTYTSFDSEKRYFYHSRDPTLRCLYFKTLTTKPKNLSCHSNLFCLRVTILKYYPLQSTIRCNIQMVSPYLEETNFKGQLSVFPLLPRAKSPPGVPISIPTRSISSHV